MAKNISKNRSGKYSQIFLDHVKKSATNALKDLLKELFRKSRSNWGFDQ